MKIVKAEKYIESIRPFWCSIGIIPFQYPHPDKVLKEAKMVQDSLQGVYDHLISNYQKEQAGGTSIVLDTTRFLVLYTGFESITPQSPFAGNYIDQADKR